MVGAKRATYLKRPAISRGNAGLPLKYHPGVADPRPPFRWTERRASRFVIMVISGAVVLADIYLLTVVLSVDSALMGGWKPAIMVGIGAIFLFATYRFRRLLRLFLHEE
jgi:hypothetical protein